MSIHLSSKQLLVASEGEHFGKPQLPKIYKTPDSWVPVGIFDISTTQILHSKLRDIRTKKKEEEREKDQQV